MQNLTDYTIELNNWNTEFPVQIFFKTEVEIQNTEKLNKETSAVLVWVRKLSVQTHATALKPESHQLDYKIPVSQIQNTFLKFWFLIWRIVWDFFLSCFLPHLGGQAKCREATVILKVLSAASTREEPSQPSLRSWHTWRVVSGVWWPGESGWGTIAVSYTSVQSSRNRAALLGQAKSQGLPHFRPVPSLQTCGVWKQQQS